MGEKNRQIKNTLSHLQHQSDKMGNGYLIWVEAHGGAANSNKWLALWSVRSTRRIEELWLDTEKLLNSRTLSYVEDDIEFPKLTPHLLICQTLSLIRDRE